MEDFAVGFLVLLAGSGSLYVMGVGLLAVVRSGFGRIGVTVDFAILVLLLVAHLVGAMVRDRRRGVKPSLHLLVLRWGQLCRTWCAVSLIGVFAVVACVGTVRCGISIYNRVRTLRALEATMDDLKTRISALSETNALLEIQLASLARENEALRTTIQKASAAGVAPRDFARPPR